MTHRLVALLFLLLAITVPAGAASGHLGGDEDVKADEDESIFMTTAHEDTDPVEKDGTDSVADPESTQGPLPSVKYVPLCLHGEATLEGSAFGCPSGEQLGCGDDGHLFTVYVTFPGRPTQASTECIEPGDPQPEATPPIDIPGEVLKEFKKVPLPKSTISIQPPGGETLVNFKTILSTPAAQHQVTVHLDKVDIDVVLELTPSHFLWKHGDDTDQETSFAGTAWFEGADVDGDDFITHVYTQKLKSAQVSVDTTWSARFKGPDDKDWRAVNGTVTKVGVPVSLTVLEATPQLVTDPN